MAKKIILPGGFLMLHNPQDVMPERTARLFDAIVKLWPDELSEKFILVGGTALALRIAHRTSEDLDLFSIDERISPQTSDVIHKFLKALKNEYGMVAVVRGADTRQVDYWIEGVKVSFCARGLDFINENCDSIDRFKIASMETLIAMKAKAIQAQRTKSRDFFDVATLIHHDYVSFAKTWETMAEKYPDAPFAESMLIKRLLDIPLDDDDEGFSALETFNDLPTDFEGLQLFMEQQIVDHTLQTEVILKKAACGVFDDGVFNMRFGLGGNTLLQALFMADEEDAIFQAASLSSVDVFKKNYSDETILDDLHRAGRDALIPALLNTSKDLSIISIDAFKKERRLSNPALVSMVDAWQIENIAKLGANSTLEDAVSKMNKLNNGSPLKQNPR